MNLLFVIGGILALGIGAELIVRGAINLSNIYKLSGYFIGFTIVAFGTSIPELSATLSAITYPTINSVGIALGNIIGSNIANILLIVGIIAIIKDIEFANQKEKKDETVIVLFITFVVVALFIGLAEAQLSSPATVYVGIVLICILLGYLIWEYIIEKNSNEQNIKEETTFSQFLSYIFLIIGLSLLIFGSYYFVLGAKNLATSFGVSEAVIGFTLVAFGTSLPELATGMAAALKNQTKIAIGTILGSNVYNIVGIFAVILFVRGDDFPNSIDLYLESLLIMALATIIFTVKVRKGLRIGNLHFKPYRIGKRTGSAFLLFYVLYLIYSYY